MATATPTKGSAPAQRATTAPAATEVEVGAVSRREFLYYIWGASLVLLLGQATAGLIWFALPRFREGEFGGVFRFAPEDFPRAGDGPVAVPSGRFHLSNSDAGLVALYGVCTHLGCLPRWEDSVEEFQCPCHGSRFNIRGQYLGGPAPRGLDRFPLALTMADGRVLSNSEDGLPISLGSYTMDDIVDVAVDTGDRVLGPPHGA
jgi:cytochrome b6-f complex iron-sulfur subunit